MARLSIKPADFDKWYLRVAMNWFIKKYTGGKNSDIIHKEMQNCGNPVIRDLVRRKDDVLSKAKGKHQKQIIDKITEFVLWILYKDTAYRQVFFYVFKNILDDKEKLMPILNEYYREPEDWYLNNWIDSKNITKKKIASGEIGEEDLSNAEKYYIPSITGKLIYEELENEAKKNKYRQKGV